MNRPNVLLIFCDQLRFDAVGALGHPVLRTPNLDRLVREGAAFTSAYTTSPVCVPARCSLAYGQYAWTTKCYDNQNPMPEDGRPSLMGALTAAGYRTHGIGKCHFTPDGHALRGFESREEQEEIVGEPERDDYHRFLRANGCEHITDPHGVRGEMYYVPQPAQMPARLHPTQWVGDRSVEFLRASGRGRRPWFLFSSFVHPHPPFAPPVPWHKLYRGPLMPLPRLPPGHEALWTHVNRHQNRYKYRDQGYDLNLVRQMRAYYFACVSFIDFQVGRMLEVLERAGQADNTLIVFTSDHGEHLGDYGCFGKRSYHDTASRIPLLLRLPGSFAGGARCDAPASLADVAPTILAAATGGRGGMAADGVDLAALASGRVDRDAVFCQYSTGVWGEYTMVTRRHKFVYSAPDGREFLFDRIADPQETRSQDGLVFCRTEQNACRARLVAALRAAAETEVLDGERWKAHPAARMPANPDAGLLRQDHPWAQERIPGYSDGPFTTADSAPADPPAGRTARPRSRSRPKA
jgi:arylsulfatase A-like enzyme